MSLSCFTHLNVADMSVRNTKRKLNVFDKYYRVWKYLAVRTSPSTGHISSTCTSSFWKHCLQRQQTSFRQWRVRWAFDRQTRSRLPERGRRFSARRLPADFYAGTLRISTASNGTSTTDVNSSNRFVRRRDSAWRPSAGSTTCWLPELQWRTLGCIDVWTRWRTTLLALIVLF